MKFHIPFTVSSLDKLRKKPKIFKSLIKYKRKSRLSEFLKNSDVKISREVYLNICFRSFILHFFILIVFSTTLFALIGLKNFYVLSFGFALIFSSFTLFSQIIYPKIYSVRRERDIERNLIPALEDVLVQLNSGIPLYSILVNVSASDYGELSKEFRKAVLQMNAGLPQIQVLEELGEKNSSVFFRRTLWQISNGMKAGSDISIVIKDSINALSEEQLIQIQKYGNKLNPLIMFYMLASVIMPALAITFLTVISSLISLPETMSTLLYIGLFVFVVLLQIMFLGVVKSTRPSLLNS